MVNRKNGKRLRTKKNRKLLIFERKQEQRGRRKRGGKERIHNSTFLSRDASNIKMFGPDNGQSCFPF